MRVSRAVIAVVCLAAATIAPRVGLAATTHDVESTNFAFTPAVVHAAAGDAVRWTVTEGSHNVVTYGGTQSFDSGPPVAPGSDPYEQTFAGGTVLYRCTPHSFFNAGGTCSGMCGAITDKVGAPATPAITSPADGSGGHSSPLTVTGTGEAWTTVRLSEGGSDVAEALVAGDGTWSVQVSLPAGQHTLVAKAVTVDGTFSTGSASSTFVIGGAAPDTQKPSAVISTRSLTVFTGPATINGFAFDNRGVAGVTVTGTGLIGASETVAATCVSCPAASSGWTAVLDFVLPGVYTITAVATDTSGNVSDPSASITILVL